MLLPLSLVLSVAAAQAALPAESPAVSGSSAPTAATVPSTARLLPAGTELPWTGGLVPPGARVLRKRGDAWMVPGAVMLGLAMVTTGVMLPLNHLKPSGSNPLENAGLLIAAPLFWLVGILPVIGPATGLTWSLDANSSDGVRPGLAVAYGALLAVELVGGALLIRGALQVQHLLHYDQEGPAPSTATPVTVLPVGPGGSMGATLAMGW